MSRHKHVRGMNLQDEMDDFDGEFDDYEEDDGLTPQEREQMATALIQTRELIGYEIPNLTNAKIEETLYYYYFDVAKSVDWLLGEYADKKAKANAKSQTKGNYKFPFLEVVPCEDVAKMETLVFGATSEMWSKKGSRALLHQRLGALPGSQYSRSPIATIDEGFWDDVPWGQVPPTRLGELIPVAIDIQNGIKMTGLLGGAPPKQSKLAALAAARNKARAEKAMASPTTEEQNKSVSLLDRLSKKPTPSPVPSPALVPPTSPPATDEPMPMEVDIPAPPVLPASQVSTPPPTPVQQKSPTPPVKDEEAPCDVLFKGIFHGLPARAKPSGFAASMCGQGNEDTLQRLTNSNLLFFSVVPPTKAATSQTKKGFSGPSPDDVVMAAQSQSKGLNKGTPTPKKEKAATSKSTTSQVQKGVESLKISASSTPSPSPARAKAKIDVVAEYEKSKSKRKENANLVVIGHVDAGKSTLMGRLLLDTGVVDQRTVQKFKVEAEKIGKSSFALAWILDQTGEERERGVTMDIAVNAFETEKGKFTILDAPGHRDFIPNMIAGASQADFAVMVIDSSTGEFEAGFSVRGQTKEHALLVRSMGVQRIIIAVNKLDLVQWSQDRFEEIQQQMSQFLTMAGFAPKNVSFVPCSGLSGENIVRKPEPNLMPWYSGPTLVEELETAKPVARAIEKPLRMTIADVYRGGITNPISISGRIEVGNLQVGDTLLALPAGETATVKGLEVDNEPAEWAVAGNNVQIHLSNIDPVHLRTGDVICHTDNPLVPLTVFNAKILAFESITPMSVNIHKGRLDVMGKISALLASLDKASGEVVKKKPRHIAPGTLATIKVTVTGDPLPLEKGSRIVLRNNGLTIGAGVIE